jgi:hypothetical protein
MEATEFMFEKFSLAELGFQREVFVFGGIHASRPMDGTPPLWFEVEHPHMLGGCLHGIQQKQELIKGLSE